jgi:aminoglycoside phosphotransferase (APT) family kinase protein
MSARPRDLGEVVGGEVVATAPLPWGFAHHTDLVTLGDGRRVVVKEFRGAGGRAELERAAAFAGRLVAAGIPTPPVLATDPDGDPPRLVMAYVEGTTGAEWLDTPERARTLGLAMGALAVRIGDLPVDARDGADDGTWSDPGRLSEAANRWLERIRADLPDGGAADVGRAIAELRHGYGRLRPRVAHGDFVPVNVLLAPDGRPAGVLDLGAWRIAHPWLDAAWWGWVVRTYHPAAWSTAWPSMLRAAGIPVSTAAQAELGRLQTIRCLEWVATGTDPDGPRLLAATATRHGEG